MSEPWKIDIPDSEPCPNRDCAGGTKYTTQFTGTPIELRELAEALQKVTARIACVKTEDAHRADCGELIQ